MGSAELGDRPIPDSSVRAGFRRSDCQVGPKVDMGVFAVFLACYLMVVGS
jgi:hypothetical protein